MLLCQPTTSDKDQLVSCSVLAIQPSSGPHSNCTDLSFSSRDKNCAHCRCIFRATLISLCHSKQDQPITRSILAMQTTLGHQLKALDHVYMPQVSRRHFDVAFARHCIRLSGFSSYQRLFDLSCPSLCLYTSYLRSVWPLLTSTCSQTLNSTP